MEAKKLQFEEALDGTGFGKFNIHMLVVSGSIILAMAMETSSVAFLVPASACEFNTTSEQQGLMAGMPLFGILAASNVWGYLADTRGRRKIILLALTLGFLTGCSATFAPNWIVFCFLKFLSASTMAGTYGLSTTYISECTPKSGGKRDTFIVLFTSIYAVTSGCMAALAIPVLAMPFSYYIPFLDIYFNAWRFLNIIFSVPSAIGIFLVYFAMESPKYLLSTGEEEKALDVLKKMYVINTGEDESTYKVSSVVLDEDSVGKNSDGFFRSVIKQTVPLFKPPLLKNTLLLSAIYVTVYSCVTPVGVWLPSMIDGFMKSLDKGETHLTFCQMLRSSQNDTSDLQPNDCQMNNTAMITVFGIYLFLGFLNILMSLVLPWYGTKRMLLTIEFLAGASALLVNFSSFWILTAILLTVFVSGMLNFGLLNTFSVGMFPTYVKAMGVCLTLMVGRGSAVFGINILKSLLTYNCEASFYVFGAIALIGVMFSCLLPSDNKKKIKDVETSKES